jgi:hypothetical protein
MSIKIRKNTRYAHSEGIHIETIFPLWRNWIRRRAVVLEKSPFGFRHNVTLKHAREIFLRKYKELGKMLMKLQGHDE